MVGGGIAHRICKSANYILYTNCTYILGVLVLYALHLMDDEGTEEHSFIKRLY